MSREGGAGEVGGRGGAPFFVQESKTTLCFVCVGSGCWRWGAPAVSPAHVRRPPGASLALPNWHGIQSSPDSPGKSGQRVPLLCWSSGAQQSAAARALHLGTRCAEPGVGTSSLGATGTRAPTAAHPILTRAEVRLRDRSEGPEPALDTHRASALQPNRSGYKAADWEIKTFLQKSPKGRRRV